MMNYSSAKIRRVRFLLLLMATTFHASMAIAEPELLGQWRFDGENEVPFAVKGKIHFGDEGPRSPEFPDFGDSNNALRLLGGYLVLDPEASQPFTFTNGETITIEAWARLEELSAKSPMYIIGKGRSGSSEFAADNQNWGLRLVQEDGVARLSYLFATPDEPGNAHWHRWTSTGGIHVESGWHHVAVRYTFGEPKSIAGWINGKVTTGKWDMGGATTKPPVNDADTVWIGSALNGNPSSTFKGRLDNVAVYRGALPDETMVARFSRVGPPRVGEPLPATMPDFGALSKGTVHVTISDGLASHMRWPYSGEEKEEPALAFDVNAFLLSELPLQYDEWGIRTGWDAPLIVRLAADVPMEVGDFTYLLRSRSLGRLWVDGTLVAESAVLNDYPPNGEEPLTPLAEPPLPGLRPHGYRIQEIRGSFRNASPDRHTARVVLEIIVGGPNIRTEIGEACIAVMTPSSDTFDVLTPMGGARIALTDEAVDRELNATAQILKSLDDSRRRTAATSVDAYWTQRHDQARAWATANPTPLPPTLDSVDHPVDQFIQAKIERALASNSADDASTQQFHNNVYPILSEACFRCHAEKAKGGLRLDSLDAILLGGDSEIPAVVPGQPQSSELIARITTEDEDERMPPTDLSLSEEEIAALTSWIEAGAPWPEAPVAAEDVALASPIDDYSFIRRVYFDTVGVPPTPQAIEAFVSDSNGQKRDALVNRMLEDERVADNWMGFWQDMLAENPTLINASLNSTGPFRWFIYDALRDNKPLDRMVTELIMMRGGVHEGGSAGFALAAENDSPFAAKGNIVATAFLGVELQCARCHDSPFHSTTQGDLFALAAMLGRKPLTVPKTSVVPPEFFSKLDRKPLIEVTLAPGQVIEPKWPFTAFTGEPDGAFIADSLTNPNDTRERLAALITSPANTRFPRVMVNRIWDRLMGAAIVQPLHDWEGRSPSHPELLDWLACELVSNDYDLKHVMRLIMTSDAYQREALGDNKSRSADLRFFNAPDPRRLVAEQVVDALHASTDRSMDVEPLTFVHDGRRPLNQRLTLGTPTRGWMFANLANERDRPSLSLPKAQSIADVLEAFGWTGARQKPIVARDTDPNVLQPGVLANGSLTASLTRASEDSALAQLAIDTLTPEHLLSQLFLRFLSRPPSAGEQATFLPIIASGFDDRILPPNEQTPREPWPELPLVTWFNHLQGEANTIQIEWDRRTRIGPAPDPRLQAEWREAYEDVAWSLVNLPEFVWIP